MALSLLMDRMEELVGLNLLSKAILSAFLGVLAISWTLLEYSMLMRRTYNVNMRISGHKLNISFSLHIYIYIYIYIYMYILPSYATGALCSTDS